MRLTSERLKKVIREVIEERRMETNEESIGRFLNNLQSEEGYKTIAIITAENPPAKMVDPNDPENAGRFKDIQKGVNDQVIPWDNDENMQSLMQDLDAANLDYMEVEGEYFGPETSFLVFDIPKQAAMKLGKKYLQDAIVFGQKMQASNLSDLQADPSYQGRDPESLMRAPAPGEKNIYVDFTMINLQANHFSANRQNDRPSRLGEYHIEDERNMVIAGDETQKRTNLFTSAAGRKFVIPFYSPDSEHQAMDPEDLYNVSPVREE
tara:strand:+ start:220 stop:1014 length:795 start_codon:yes stop_codon:yes gene_type:complete